MYKATSLDKELVLNVLTKAFFDNKSFNLIVRQDDRKEDRIRTIFDYYFDIYINNGFIYISDDRKACAMISVSGKRKLTLISLWKDIKLMLDLGIKSALKGFNREKMVANARPNFKYHYLLFLGVIPEDHGKGIGSKLMREITNNNPELVLPMCLETSTTTNIAFYSKFGFRIYHEMSFGFPLYFMMREIQTATQ